MLNPVTMHDGLEIVSQHGLAWFVFVSVVCIVFLLAGLYIRDRWRGSKGFATRLGDQVDRLEKAWTGPNGKMLDQSACLTDAHTTLAEIRQIATRFDSVFMQHVKDTERVAQEDHWKNCPVEKCPHLQRFSDKIDGIAEDIADFAEEAKFSQESTQEAIGVIMRRFDDFASHALAALRNSKTDKSKEQTNE